MDQGKLTIAHETDSPASVHLSERKGTADNMTALPGTLAALAEESRARLDRAGVASPEIAAGWVIENHVHVGRLEIPARGAMRVDAKTSARVAADVDRIAGGEPPQYVVGWTSFMGARIHCDPRALIPRMETEELVDRALQLPAPNGGRERIADVGTGTGCIAIAVALRCEAAHILAIDASADALALARHNVEAHGLAGRVRLVEGDLLHGVGRASLDLVIANLPYVTEVEYAALDPAVRDHEPPGALRAGRDGLDAIRRLVPQARESLRQGGWLVLEMGAGQGDPVQALMEGAGFRGVRVHLDLANRPRIVQGQRGIHV